MSTLVARRRPRFDEGTLTHAAITVGAIVVGAFLILLGHVLRSVDDHLADFD